MYFLVSVGNSGKKQKDLNYETAIKIDTNS